MLEQAGRINARLPDIQTLQLLKPLKTRLLPA